MNPIAEAANELQKIADSTYVYGFEYPDYPSANAVMESVKAFIDNRDDSGHDSSRGASVWVARDGETETRIFVWIADTGLDLYGEVEWGDARLMLPGGDARRALLDRHIALCLENYDPSTGLSHSRTRWALGAELRPGNDLRARVGGDQ